TFILRNHPLGEFVRKTLPIILFALAGLVAVTGGVSRWRGRAVAGISPRVAIFVVVSLALGPGLVVNTVLKDNWGRPRPSTVTEFGGPHAHVPVLIPSDQCSDNCSFPSGHAALGFWVLAFALVAPPPWRRPAIFGALGFGALVGAVRIAQGGHFLSDVISSGVIVGYLTRWLYVWMVAPYEILRRKNYRADSAEAP
ncbi:MAG: phosphatase PAP2 family protein, partial [Rhodospirillaceae bacterium]|nr:phosphatase PAP2 family protein [Rhodospirillaceae bacterium]